MKGILLILFVLACCSTIAMGEAYATPRQDDVSPTVSAGSSGTLDEYAGQGDLITHAVPVCCCNSSSACDQDPPPPVGTPCKVGTPACKCGGGILCVLMP